MKTKREKSQSKPNVAWRHPGGKFRRAGPGSCSETELLAIVLGSGSRGKSAEQIAGVILGKYGTISDLMGVSLKELMTVKVRIPLKVATDSGESSHPPFNRSEATVLFF